MGTLHPDHDEREATEQLYEQGRAEAAATMAEIAPLFGGRRMTIEFGCGIGEVLLGHEGNFERLRGVDLSPRSLELLQERASLKGIPNVQTFLPDEHWDWPTGAADYVYCSGVFQYMEDRVQIAHIIQRMSGVLRRNGLALLQFDTRPRTRRYRTSRHLPDFVLPPEARRGVRSIRREPEWVWDRLRGADLETFGHRNWLTADHWFYARRR
jgi:cyclopropane fatty-acyl-phospholipid synthase-like methyltransferase